MTARWIDNLIDTAEWNCPESKAVLIIWIYNERAVTGTNRNWADFQRENHSLSEPAFTL
jgi:hypothetical protein